MTNFNIRLVSKEDYYCGHLELYKQLSTINPELITKIDYESYIDKLNDDHIIYVINDNNIIIGSLTIFIEYKLLRNMGKVGHIEDVVIDRKYNGQGLGKKLINKAVEYCKNKNCYKIILNCSDENIGFYEKCGFKKKENEMALYLTYEVKI